MRTRTGARTGTKTRPAEPAPLRVGLIGTFNLDRLLLQVEGEERVLVSAGGLAYSLQALRHLLPGATLLPLAWLSEPDSGPFRPLLAQPGIAPEGLLRWPEPGNQVTLDCRAEAKPETALLCVPPLPREALEPALGCPQLLLNCTSGRDLELDAWRTLVRDWRRVHPTGWLQLDWHSLSLDWEVGRERRLRQVPHAFAWVEGLDLLQLTLAECASLTPRPPRRLEDAADFCLRLRKAGCRRVVISDGARGFLFSDAGGCRRQAAWPVDRLVDTTGCGDVLGAALLASLGQGWKVEKALALAAEAAGRVCGAAGLESLAALSSLTSSVLGERGAGFVSG